MSESLFSTTSTTSPIATIRGQPLAQLPCDLYIPPQALEVLLEAFTGPLDLLLYLIKKQNFDILDIPVAEITRQYMHNGQRYEYEVSTVCKYSTLDHAILKEKEKVLQD